jgi:hypothetical protein
MRIGKLLVAHISDICWPLLVQRIIVPSRLDLEEKPWLMIIHLFRIRTTKERYALPGSAEAGDCI